VYARGKEMKRKTITEKDANSPERQKMPKVMNQRLAVRDRKNE